MLTTVGDVVRVRGAITRSFSVMRSVLNLTSSGNRDADGGYVGASISWVEVCRAREHRDVVRPVRLYFLSEIDRCRGEAATRPTGCRYLEPPTAGRILESPHAVRVSKGHVENGGAVASVVGEWPRQRNGAVSVIC
jgi:hypothetical protein